MRIRNKILSSLLVVALVPLLISIVHFSAFEQGHDNHQIMQHIETVASLQKARVLSIYQQNLESLDLIVSRTQLKKSLNEFVISQKVSEQARISNILLDVKNAIKKFESITVYDVNGSLVSSTEKSPLNNKPISDVDEYFEAFTLGLKNKQARLYKLDKHYHLMAYLSAPIYKNGTLLGVLVIKSTADNLMTSISDYTGLKATGETILAMNDKQGGVVFLMPTRYDINTRYLERHRHRSNIPIDFALKGIEKTFTNLKDYRNVSVLSATRFIKEADWGLVVKIDKKEAFSHISRLRNEQTILIFISVIIASLLAYYLSRKITTPIIRLTDTAQKIASGQLLSKANDSSQDEVGELGRAFNFMTTKLVYMNTKVEEEVQKLTQSEDKVLKVNKSLKALILINETISHASTEKELLTDVCRVVTNEMGFSMAWIGFKKEDGNKSVVPIAQMGDDDGYLDEIKLTWANTEKGQGTVATAIRTGKADVIQNIEQSSRFAWREAAKKRHYRAIASLPLNIEGKTIGCLIIYSSQQGDFDPQTVQFLQELADDLTFGLVSMRSTVELQHLNKQLLQAQKMEAIGQLTGGIAHDFNNILTSILGFTGLALQRFVRSDQPELRGYLEEVSKAGERARDLISQMLAFSRTESSEASLIHIPPMIKEVGKMLQATLPSSIKLVNKIGSNLPKVMVDPVHIHQVLTNLCINSRDAMEGKGQITVGLSCVRIKQKESLNYSLLAEEGSHHRNICDACNEIIPSGEYIELSVQDTGTGMSNEELKHIFEPFYTTKDVGKGSGMGLSMIYGIIHHYGGHILVDTELGKGATFRLLLPVKRDEISVQQENNKLDLPVNTDSLSNARILVVDDETAVAGFIKDVLESQGAKVTTLNQSKDALYLFSRAPKDFDLIITDQTMPGMTGLELAEKILTIRHDIAMILCTGYSDYANESLAKEKGFLGYIQKPMELKALLKLVAEVLA